ncbi:MAG: SurA N-terminal domain-containing protein [Candidatus Aminicenantes bacterium]|nr:SurA N-terminal domain-containing protein [Candidatus Aminicenantes bacterium]
MLKTMRSKKKSLSWILWLLILAFVGFIFVQWGSGRFESGGLDRDVAAVGSKRISGENFQKDLTQSLAMYSKQFKNNFSRSLINQLGIAEQVLQGMVNALIIEMEADKLNLSVSETELKDAIRSYPAFQRDGGFIGSEEYERLLAYNQIKVLDFEEGLRKELLADKLKELLTSGLALDWNSIEEDYRKENDKAELETIAFKSEAVKEEPAFSAAELEEFYQDNKNLFKSHEKRSGQMLVLKFADFKKDVVIPEKEAFAYFQKNRSMFKVPGKTKISRIWVPYTPQDRDDVLKRMEAATAILTGQNFADKARELSSDEKAKDGGDWGYWGWQNFSNQERSMIDNLKQGEISSPIDAQQAFSILYVSEKIEEKQETYGEIKARITSLLENEQLKKLVNDKIGKLYAKIKEANDLKQGEDKQKMPLLPSGLLAAGDSIKNIDEMGYISQKLFTLRENEIAPPMEFPEGFAIVQLLRIVKPEVEPFEKVKDQVKTQMLSAKKLQLQLAKAQAVGAELQKLADDKKIAAYLAKENLKPESVTYQRGNQLSGFPVRPGLDEAIFQMRENAYSLPLTFGSEAAVIVKLKSKKIVSAEEFAKQKDGYYRKKLAEAENSMFGSYIMSRRNEHKISFNAEIFEKIKEYAVSRFR